MVTGNTIIEETKSTKNVEPTPSKLLAYCSQSSNNISIIDLASEQEYASFIGAQVQTEDRSDFGWTHVKEISNTKLLISLHHAPNVSASMAIFDISQRGQPSKIYSFDEILGPTGFGDVAYNPKRNLLAALPRSAPPRNGERRIAYHLFNIEYGDCKNAHTVKLMRASKWTSKPKSIEESAGESSIEPFQQNPSLELGGKLFKSMIIDDRRPLMPTMLNRYKKLDYNTISGLDFDANGEIVAAMEANGVCLISNVDTGNLSTRVGLVAKYDDWSRCRWSTNPSEPFLFLKYSLDKINVLDVEKQALIWTDPNPESNFDELDRSKFLNLYKPLKVPRYSIDVSPSDTNLLATVNSYSVGIYDRRELKIVRCIDSFHKSEVTSVRWSLEGTMIASASYDNTAKAVDLRTEKVIYKAVTADEGPAMSVCFIDL